MIESPSLPRLDRAADERTTLTEMLDFYRAVLVRKTWGLTEDELNLRLEPSTLTLGGLLLHMALVEDSWFHQRFAGNPAPEPWESAPWEADPDWEFNTAHLWAHHELLEQFEESVGRSRAVVDATESLEDLATGLAGDEISLRWILLHMVEEYARHCGHADLIRESIDGATGD